MHAQGEKRNLVSEKKGKMNSLNRYCATMTVDEYILQKVGFTELPKWFCEESIF